MPSEPTRQVKSCGIHANHWMGGTPMQYLSTASARVFLSSKLSNHNTYRWKKNTKQCEKEGKRVKGGDTRRSKQQIKCHTLVIQPTAVRHQVAKGKVSNINQTIAASLALFTAGGGLQSNERVHLGIAYYDQSWANVEVISPPLVCLCVHLHHDEDINPTQLPQALVSKPTRVHRLCIITDNDWSSHFTHQD